MQDVTQGVERSRSWPRNRGKPKNEKTKEQNDWFRQMQWATKYMDPRLLIDAVAAVKGTPLLPRDILTMLHSGRLMAFQTETGKRIYPVQAKRDVSESLDVISQQEGYTLVRGPDGWEGRAQTTGGSWTVAFSLSGFAPQADIVITDLPPALEYQVIGTSLYTTDFRFLDMHVSTNNGASFFDAHGNYVDVFSDGNQLLTSVAYNTSQQLTGPRLIQYRIIAPHVAGVPKIILNQQNWTSRQFVADIVNPINAMRIRPFLGGAIGGGSLHVLALGAA